MTPDPQTAQRWQISLLALVLGTQFFWVSCQLIWIQESIQQLQQEIQKGNPQ